MGQMDTNNDLFKEIEAELEKLYGKKPPLKVVAAYAVIGVSLEIEDAKAMVDVIGIECEKNPDFVVAAMTAVGQVFEKLMESEKMIEVLQKQVKQLKGKQHGK